MEPGEGSRGLGGMDLRAYEQFVQENRENKNRLKALKKELGNAREVATNHSYPQAESGHRIDGHNGNGNEERKIRGVSGGDHGNGKNELSLLEEIEKEGRKSGGLFNSTVIFDQNSMAFAPNEADISETLMSILEVIKK